MTLLMHFMVHFTTDMAHLVGGRTHTAHNIPSGKLCPGNAPGAGHSALTQWKNVHGYRGITVLAYTQFAHADTHTWHTHGTHTHTHTHARTHANTHKYPTCCSRHVDQCVRSTKIRLATVFAI